MSISSNSLGSLLKENRTASSLTLREVEEITNISNAYLSQLENDKIKSPSANYLYKLAQLYKMNFEELLESANIIEKNLEKDKKKVLKSSALYSKNLNREEEEELMKYLSFIRFNRKNQKDN